MGTGKSSIDGYEIVGKIGEGGMGEVYRARDRELGRDVAIKVLPEGFSTDDERLRRFQQEAQAVGALNHPNILVIYHIGTDDGAPYIVSELLEGETLRDKIAGSPLPQRKAIDYALQIAQGLAAAHEKGIIHRDLKPENIFITKDGRAKILDFGLAKLTQPDPEKAQTEIPTRRIDTDPGTIMGTVSYMSPEQVRGRALDHRTDIFSFGAILYEMLTGKQAFHGESTPDLMSSILREEPPPLSTTNSSVAPSLQRIIDHCLEKSPEERFHSASDLAFAIEALSGSTSSSMPSAIADLPRRGGNLREVAAWALAGSLLIAALTFAFLYFRRPIADTKQLTFTVEMPEKAVDVQMPIISPDSQKIAFLATDEGRTFLYLRPLDSIESKRLSGTDNAEFPFWSPDSRFIGYFADGKLKKIDVAGGPPQVLCDARQPSGGTWSRGGTIVFGQLDKPLYRVSSAGGQPTALLQLDPGRREVDQDLPFFLPDGEHLLYQSWNGVVTTAEVFVTALDGTDRRSLLPAYTTFAYANGHLLFARGTTLMAQPFDASALKLSGEPFPVLENVVLSSSTGVSNFSVADNGTLVYWRGVDSGRRLVWLDRTGNASAEAGQRGNYNDVVISPDSKRAAIQVMNGDSSDIWLLDLERGISSRFTFGSGVDDNPTWSADGSTLFYSSSYEGKTSFVRKPSSGAGAEQVIAELPLATDDGLSVSPDGTVLLYEAIGTNTGADISVLPTDGQPSSPLLSSEFAEFHAQFSPDGRWFAYASSESGRPQVYVESYPRGGGKWQISSAGGAQPKWRADGKELFFMSPDRKIMAVEIKTTPTFQIAGGPVALFQTQVSGFTSPNRFAVSKDGQRFLVNHPAQELGRTPIVVVTNWAAGLKKD